MRVTPSITDRNFLADIQNVSARMSTLERQVASGKRLFMPSDAPLDVATSLRLRAQTGRIDGFVRSIQDSQNLLNATDAVLGQLGDSITRGKDLVMQARNQTLNQQQRDMLKTELQVNVRDAIVGAANAQYDGRFIFGGTLSNVAPWTVTGPTAGALAAGVIQRTVGEGEVVEISVSAADLDTPGGTTPGLVTSINNAITALSGNDDTLMQAALDELDAHMNNLLDLRARLGSVGNRMETLATRHEEVKMGLELRRVQVEDTDYAEAIGDLTRTEVGYNASLYVGARIGRQSLVDYLR